MTIYNVKLERSEEIAIDTMEFHFSKPANFSFKPGQAIELMLTDHHQPDADAISHAFSIVSAPFQNVVTVATRMRDSTYKRMLQALPAGAPAYIDGPFGSLTLHNNRARPAVFIAGGIGITPFMSILRQAAHDELPHRLLLLYSNRRPDDAAFLHELHGLEQQNRHFRLVSTMTASGQFNRSWNGRTGVIDAPLLSDVTGDMTAPIYYLAGPSGMVDAMKKTLNSISVDDDDIRSEEFYGY